MCHAVEKPAVQMNPGVGRKLTEGLLNDLRCHRPGRIASDPSNGRTTPL